MKSITIGAIVSTIVVSGCATASSGIEPTEVPVSRYASLDCAAGRAELASREAVEADLARRQDTAARRDTAGVALIGVPVGSLFRGDVGGQLAQVRGEVRALRQHVQERC